MQSLVSTCEAIYYSSIMCHSKVLLYANTQSCCLRERAPRNSLAMVGKPKTRAHPSLRALMMRKSNRIIEEAPARYPFEREGLVTEVLRKTHICACCGSNEKSVKVLKAQMHGVHGFGGIVHKVYNRSHGNNNSNIDGNNITTSFHCEEFDCLHNLRRSRLSNRKANLCAPNYIPTEAL